MLVSEGDFFEAFLYVRTTGAVNATVTDNDHSWLAIEVLEAKGAVIREDSLVIVGDPFERTDWTCFRVYLNVEQTNTGDGTNTLVAFDTVAFDLRGEFNTTTHLLTVDQGGIYEFGTVVVTNEMVSGARLQIRLRVDGAGTHSELGRIQTSNGANLTASGSAIVELDAGQTVEVRAIISGTATGDFSSGSENTYFWGKKIRNKINP